MEIDGSDEGLGELARGPADEPTQAMPSTPPATTPPSELPPAVGSPSAVGPPSAPPVDATQVMPVVASLPPRAATGAAPPPPPQAPGATFEPVAAGAVPPRRVSPAVVAGIGLGVVTLLAIGVVVLFSSDDGDSDDVLVDVSSDPVSLSILRTDEAGAPVASTVAATVTAAPRPSDYTWVVPGDTTVGQPAIRPTNAAGRVDFRWADANDEVGDAAWSSTVSLGEVVGAHIDNVTGECSLVRDGVTDAYPITFELVPDSSSESQLLRSTFPGAALVSGDRVDCTVVDIAGELLTPVESSTSSVETTTSIAETTTSVAPTTTVPETTTTTTTTVPDTTTSTTTTTTTTTTTSTTLPVVTAPLLSDELAARSELADALALFERVGLIAELEASATPFTLFVPTNDVIQEFIADPGSVDMSDDDQVRNLMLVHVVRGEALTEAEIGTRVSIAVAAGGPQLVESPGPIVVGDAELIDVDIDVDGGVFHVIDAVLQPEP